jgi:hypothetical protein
LSLEREVPLGTREGVSQRTGKRYFDRPPSLPESLDSKGRNFPRRVSPPADASLNVVANVLDALGSRCDESVRKDAQPRLEGAKMTSVDVSPEVWARE